MNGDGSNTYETPQPLWLLAELTYRCPLQCPYCSNPVDFARYKDELSTEDWLRVLREARELGCAQLGFSGGEPLLRRDLETLVEESRKLGYYTNLITSAVGMDTDRVARLKEAGLDHIQISFQASRQDVSDYIAGTKSYERKIEMARTVKSQGYPMVLNIVLHRHNLDHISEILDLAADLDADYVELANTQYYGWAYLNRDQLLPTREQVERAEEVANRYQERYKGQMEIFFVAPDYFDTQPKACMGGWGNVFLGIAPDGMVLPCQSARDLPGITFPNVQNESLGDIWYRSEAFNRFRGFDWMPEPCASCPERFNDFGGCRCQAYLLTGDPARTDPVCSLSPDHHKIAEALDEAAERQAQEEAQPLVFRNPRNSRKVTP